MSPEASGADLKRTALFARHAALGARLMDFHGWALPLQFSGILAEHRAVRAAAGLFDISHLGQIAVEGPGALGLVQRLTVNDAARLEVGQVQYSALCNGEGGIMDDFTVFRLAPERFMLCVNAANARKDLDWVRGHAGEGARVEDRGPASALLALQGPKAEAILAPLADPAPPGLRYYRFAQGRVAGRAALVSRTGYTGEDGFEIFLAGGDAPAVWDAILEAGRPHGLVPAGLGARDTLRLEMGYALWGNDIDETTDPFEAGLGWITRLEKGDFVGREALLRRRAAGTGRTLAGFEMRSRAIPRRGHAILAGGAPAGAVTSGTFSPSLGRGIGLGYLPRAHASAGSPLQIEVRGTREPAEVARLPFYRAGSLRRT